MTVQVWNLPPPPEFQGLREDLPLKVYTRHLPHWRQLGATYFVTYRLGDSLPQAKLDELDSIRRDWTLRLKGTEENASREELESLVQSLMKKHEGWLDEGHGACHMRCKDSASIVADSMHHFDNQRYELNAFVVMPNHVHVILRPLGENSLEDITGSWKQYSARQINERLGQRGTLWQDESYDRIIRDEEHLYRSLQYIGNNPTKIGVLREDCCCWIRPAWQELGWSFEPERQ